MVVQTRFTKPCGKPCDCWVLTAAHYRSAEWNPLGGFVRPSDRVVLKPNFVRNFRESSPEDGDCLVTHGAVIRAVLDYVYIAL